MPGGPALGCSAGVPAPQAQCRADRKRQKRYAKKKRQEAKRKNTFRPVLQRELYHVPMVFWALAFTAYLVRCTTDHVVLLARRTLLAKAIGSARCFVRWLVVSVDKVISRTLVDAKGKNAAKNARRKARKRVAKLQARGCCIYIPQPPVDLLVSPQSEKATCRLSFVSHTAGELHQSEGSAAAGEAQRAGAHP